MAAGSKEKLLQVARDLFYKNGFLATSVDDIIAQAKVSKSNFYYHFRSKEELGLAVLDQRRGDLDLHLAGSLGNHELCPRERLRQFVLPLVQSQSARTPGGCPFGNLVAEMSEHSERFRCRLSGMFAGLTVTIAEVVAEGQRFGEFRRDLEASAVAALIVQTIQGAHLMAKCHRNADASARGAELLLRLVGSE